MPIPGCPAKSRQQRKDGTRGILSSLYSRYTILNAKVGSLKAKGDEQSRRIARHLHTAQLTFLNELVTST